MDQIEDDYSPRLGGGAGVTSVGVYRSVDGFDLEMLQVRPDGAGPFPALCLFFGGGWAKGSPLQFVEQAKYLSSRGISVFLPDYRVASRHGSRLVESVEDATAAFAWLVQNAAALDVHPDQIALGGGSAGGYLAAAVALFGADAQDVETSPAALVLFNPALDLNGITPALREAMAEPSQPFHGVRLAEYTLEGRTSATLPPAVIMHGRADGVVSYESVERVVRAATLAGNDWHLIGYEGQQHGFWNHPSFLANGPKNGWQFAATLEQVDLFLAAQGWLSGPPTLSTIVSWQHPNKPEA
jgi:acetyl esterase